MNRGSSANISSAGHVDAAACIASWYQISLSLFHSMEPPVLLITIEVVQFGQLLSASSTFCLRGIDLPPRTPSSEVIMHVESQSIILPASASGENPPNTTE